MGRRMTPDYPCTKCGQCCSQLWKVLENREVHPIITELIEQFPYKTRADGSCEMMTEDNLCSIYDHRPALCNIKQAAARFEVSEAEWFKVNRDGCNQLIREAGLDPKFLVVLDDG